MAKHITETLVLRPISELLAATPPFDYLHGVLMINFFTKVFILDYSIKKATFGFYG